MSNYQVLKEDCVLWSSSYSLVNPCRLVYLFCPLKGTLLTGISSLRNAQAMAERNLTLRDVIKMSK